MQKKCSYSYSEEDFRFLSTCLDEIVNRLQVYKTEPIDKDKIQKVIRLIQQEGDKLQGKVQEDIQSLLVYVEKFMQNSCKETFEAFLSKAVKLKNDLWSF